MSPFLFLVSVFALLLLPYTANAHFDVGTKTREFVIFETKTTTEVYVRTPIPLLFGDILDGSVEDSHGFLGVIGAGDDARVHLIPQSVEAARAAFAARLNDSLVWTIRGRPVGARVRGYRILADLPEIPLTSTAAGEASLALPSAQAPVDIGLGYVDILVSITALPGLQPLRLNAGYPPIELSDGVNIDNHIVDVRSDQRMTYTRPGQLERSIALPRSRAGVLTEYVFQGVVHILEGIDHVFLVVVMALGAATTPTLIRWVTGFTLGHALTLVAGFLGYVPQGAWFIPAVEASIAATIVFSAASSLMRKGASAFLYTGIGLLHGFGFSFVLARVLRPDAPDFLPAIAAFTVGIEIGQLAIVVLVLAVMSGLRLVSETAANHLRTGVLVALGLVASWMVIERVPLILAG